ncbi:MAG: NUDIX domain-containing protein [Christensenellales bacterium]
MEKWDLYDKNFNKLNKTANRGDKLNDDEYHLVINAWIINDKNEFLITQRCPHKSHPCMWECTGGSALMGETDIDACVREIKEELGIDIDVSTAQFIGVVNRYYVGCPDILRVYLFRDNTSLEDVKIQEEEVMNVMWADKDKILELYNQGKFEANAFFKEVLEIKYK